MLCHIVGINTCQYCKIFQLIAEDSYRSLYITTEIYNSGVINIARWSSDVSESDLSQVSNLQGHFETQINHISNNRLCGVQDVFSACIYIR